MPLLQWLLPPGVAAPVANVLVANTRAHLCKRLVPDLVAVLNMHFDILPQIGLQEECKVAHVRVVCTKSTAQHGAAWQLPPTWLTPVDAHS